MNKSELVIEMYDLILSLHMRQPTVKYSDVRRSEIDHHVCIGYTDRTMLVLFLNPGSVMAL